MSNLLVDVNVKTVMKVEIDAEEAFSILCKNLAMDFVLDEDREFFVGKDDGVVYEKVDGKDICIDDRGGLFIALRNVAVNMFPNLYFRSAEYIWKNSWEG